MSTNVSEDVLVLIPPMYYLGHSCGTMVEMLEKNCSSISLEMVKVKVKCYQDKAYQYNHSLVHLCIKITVIQTISESSLK